MDSERGLAAHRVMFQSRLGCFQGLEGEGAGSGVAVSTVGGDPDAVGFELMAGSGDQQEGQDCCGGRSGVDEGCHASG
ncbi:MAG: hypothetical protein RI897_3321 [Verrucomicrobiota bacterium]